MNYATICSGINAPAVAWDSLGWHEQFCAEIEKFPCSVLKQRYPHVPNLGDITKYADWPNFRIKILAGGTPCQSFSLAGLRKGMDDPRGQLTRSFVGVAAKYRPEWLVWENVPGVFSADGGEAFAGFLAGLTGCKVSVPAEGWGSFGVMPGIPEAYGIAWRVLDTQFVTVDTHPRACPQRRERVFVVGHLGGCWQRAAAVLLERESLCGNPAPCRTTGQGASGTLSARTQGGGGLGTDFECSGGLVARTLLGKANSSHAADQDTYVAHSLTGEGFDASEDGTGRGTPLVAQTVTADMYRSGGAVAGNNNQGVRNCIVAEVSPTMRAGGNQTGGDRPPGTDVDTADSLIAFDTTQITSKANVSNPQPGDPCHPLASGAHPPAIAFTSKDHGADATEDLSPTLRAMEHDGSHANGGDQIAVAFQTRIARNGRGNMGEVVNALQAQSGQSGKGDAAPCVAIAFEPRYYTRDNKTGGKPGDVSVLKADAEKAGDSSPHVATGTAVRRLTPRECARLQGFPDDHLDVMHNGKLAKDGPKYRALGNAMSVNVMRWIGQRIAMVDALP